MDMVYTITDISNLGNKQELLKEKWDEKFLSIPSGWKKEKLSYYVLSMDSGMSLNVSDKPIGHNDVGILKTSAVTTGKFLPSENKKYIDSDRGKLKCPVLKNNILVVRKNTPDLVGSTCFVESDYPNLFLPDLIWQTNFKDDVEVDRKWLFYLLNINYYQNIFSKLASGTSESMVNIKKKSFLNIDLVVPPLQEQTRISRILSTWDKAIVLKENLIEEKKSQKTALMQKLLTGTVRLPGFEEEWKEVKLRTVLKKVNDKSQITNELELYSLTIENGVTPKTDRYNREFLVKADNKKYKVTKLNDIVYNPANLRFGAIAVNRISNPVLLSPIYEVLRLKNDKLFNLDFIGQLLTWDRTINLFSTMAEGTLVERMAVKIDTFLDVNFRMPKDVEEQKAISNILNFADLELHLLEKEIEHLKEQKKGLMQLLLTGIIRVNIQRN